MWWRTALFVFLIGYYHTRNNSDYNQTMNRKNKISDQAVQTTGLILWNALDQGFPTCGAAREGKLCGPWSHIHFNSINGIIEIMKPKSTVLQSSAQLILCSCNMMALVVKILWKIYKNPLILLHAACLKTWLTGVRPAVDLSWKALLLMIISKM